MATGPRIAVTSCPAASAARTRAAPFFRCFDSHITHRVNRLPRRPGRDQHPHCAYLYKILPLKWPCDINGFPIFAHRPLIMRHAKPV